MVGKLCFPPRRGAKKIAQGVSPGTRASAFKCPEPRRGDTSECRPFGAREQLLSSSDTGLSPWAIFSLPLQGGNPVYFAHFPRVMMRSAMTPTISTVTTTPSVSATKLHQYLVNAVQ